VFPDTTNVFGLIVKLSFIGFYVSAFTHNKREGIMEKRLVVIKQGKQEGIEFTKDMIKVDGWKLETIELSKGEPLPRSLENIDGLLILGDAMNVFEQSSSPLTVYLNS